MIENAKHYVFLWHLINNKKGKTMTNNVEQSKSLRRKILGKAIKWGIVAAVIGTPIWVEYVSIIPKQKEITEILDAQDVENSDMVVGDAFTATNLFLIDTLLNKNGGFLSNDVLVKLGVYDNMPAWELGALYMVRDSADSLRVSFSRSRSQSLENENLKKGVPLLNYDNRSWMLPESEAQYKKAHEEIGKYLSTISDPSKSNAQFYARADNLAEWLQKVSGRLGSYSQMLSASKEQERENIDLANDPNAQQSTYSSETVTARTSYMKIDDVFWEVRGASWALIHLMKAAEEDFGDVLEKKNALVSMKQIIRELEDTQQFKTHPMVLNGEPFGWFANHSLSLANYISRINASINDMITILNNG